MTLYWAMFTLGFLFGAILAFVVFAPKKPQDDPEYETPTTTPFKWQSQAPSLETAPDILPQTLNMPIIDQSLSLEALEMAQEMESWKKSPSI